MLVAEASSQIRVGGLLGGTSAQPSSTASRSSYAGDWIPPSNSSSLPGTSCWPIPGGRPDFGASSNAGAGAGASPPPGTSCWPLPGGHPILASSVGGASKPSYATAGPIFDRSPSPSPSPTPSAGPTSQPSPQPSPTPSPSPGPVPQPPHIPTPAEIAAQKHELQTAKIDATLAQDVYKDPPNPPAGYHVANEQELTKLGLTPQMLDDGRSDFRARVYIGQDGRTVVAYRGSLSKEDWKNDIQQGAGFHSDYYDRAIDIGQRIERSGANVTFTGHSLGGGLASASAIASGQQADTFNAAGITSRTIDQAKTADEAAGGDGKGAHVDAYYDGGDPLSAFQDANAGGGGLVGGGIGAVIGGIFGGPPGAILGGILGGGIGAVAGHVPSAYGDRHALATIDPPGGGSVLDRHSMDYVQRGLDKALSELH